MLDTRRGVRAAMVRAALARVLRSDDRATPRDVVDLGGGTGGLGVDIAESGHRVTVVDPSPNALAALEQRAAEAGVADRIRGALGDAHTLVSLVGAASADLVICHGVLEHVDDPGEALTAVARVLRPGGYLSLLVAQRSGAVLSRVLGGHVAAAAVLLDRPSDQTPRVFSRRGLETLATAAALTVVEVRGIAVFAEHASARLLDAEPGAEEWLTVLEQAVHTDPDFMAMAAQLHLLARRD